MSDTTLSNFLSRFNKLAKSCQRFCFLVRDSSFQELAMRQIKQFCKIIASEKGKAKKSNNEVAGNLFACIELMCGALYHELAMWSLLKQDCPDEAWDQLVGAQHCAELAIRAHKSGDHLGNYINRLLFLESTLFPPQIFASVGAVIKESKCSICGLDYEDCDHLKGHFYTGTLCTQIISQCDLKEVSIVHNPADKKCRAYKFTCDGAMRNVMTWLPVDADRGKSSPRTQKRLETKRGGPRKARLRVKAKLQEGLEALERGETVDSEQYPARWKKRLKKANSARAKSSVKRRA